MVFICATCNGEFETREEMREHWATIKEVRLVVTKYIEQREGKQKR